MLIQSYPKESFTLLEGYLVKLQEQLVKSQNRNEKFQVYKICRSGCTNNNPNMQDLEMYIGRVQINLNDGKKRKYLYFQSDYKLQGVN